MADKSKIILVTGASSGIGAAIAQHLAQQGHAVFGTSRNANAAPPAAGVRIVAMDVRREDSVAAAVAQVMQAAGRIDVLVNNAGYGIVGSIEDTRAEDMARQLDTNLMGPLRVCQAVLPAMRAQRAGRIIQVSSLAARIGIPFQGAYSASKSALEGMTEALSMEVKPFGIDVVLVQPGDTRSNFGAAREWTEAAKANAVYRMRAQHALKVMEKSEQTGPPPDKVARIVAAAVAARRPKLRYVSVTPLERFALALQRALPGRVFEGVVSSIYAVPHPK